MAKVLTEKEHDKLWNNKKTPINDKLKYSEQYEVAFNEKNITTGFIERKNETYYSTTKSAHKVVEKVWKKLHPTAILISVNYQ